MKKKYFLNILLIVACFMNSLEAQTQTTKKSKHTDRYYNAWRLGLNIGGMWQTSDVKRASAGAGLGFTLEKGFLENKTHFFSLAIKGRGLWGNTYGLDYGRNYNILDDPALNGKYNTNVNYDSVAANGGAPFIYNNYKTKIAEGALELQICFNQLRERTNILLNLWGGIGFTSYRTTLNLLDKNGKEYNYFKVDSAGTGSSSSVLSSHKFLLDDSYESNANFSQNGNVITWSPSCGVGLGYRFNDFISLIWEYKLTFPQGTYSDYLDGFEKHNNDWIGCNKDYYHYTGLNMTIRLGGKGGKSQSSNNVNNYTPTQTNTIVNIPTNTVVTSVPTNSVAIQAVKPPNVTITNPPSSPYNVTTTRNFTVATDIFNVTNRNQLYITYNNAQVTNYTWDGKTAIFPVQLNVGNNFVGVTATNTAGSDSKQAVINYSGIPPQITITSPGTNKYTSTANNSDVYATILNVESPQYIAVTLNGQAFYNFSYDVTTKVFGMNTALNSGTNTVLITASNLFGQDQKTQLLIYKPVTINSTGTAVKSVSVVITDPTLNPFKSASATYKVKAKVTGVSSQSQVTVTANSAAIPFNYLNGNVDFDVPISNGNALVNVSASNGRSSDSKSTMLTYEAPKKVAPPTVTIVNPNPSPYTTTLTTYSFKAQTKNIANNSQLIVKFNGFPVTNYAFDSNTGIIDYNANLNVNANNIFDVTATNPYGTANASGIVKQEQPKTKMICHRKDRATMETITIFENEWPMHQSHGDYEGPCANAEPAIDPDITICHNNKGIKQTITIKQSQWASHQAHGDVMGTCQADPGNEIGLDPDITICHNNKGLKQTITIKQSQWASHQAHGDVMGTCPANPGNEIGLDPDITICHNNKGLKQTITIKQSQWASHQAHGDVMGTCQADPGNEIGLDPDITICHNNKGLKQTITIKQSQWASHQAHGDVMGTCQASDPGNEIGLDPDITICHKNNDGSVVKMTIKQSQWASHQAHGDFVGSDCTTSTNTTSTAGSTVEICHNNGDGTKTTMVIPFNQYPSHRAHGDILGKCAETPVQPPITICHNNGNGTKTTMTITADQWATHSAHGDAQGTCPPEERMITICHIPPGNTGNPQTIEISESAWPAHEAHGDTKGACPTPTVEPEDKKITICHIPPGNNQNPQTIEINESAWPAHQAHGDTKGECAPANNNNNTGSGKIQICHIPPGNNQNPQTIEIPESAWPAHEAHGDSKQPCATGEKKITICHIPPGNPNNPQTIEIAESAWPAHAAHGDTKGACDDGKGKGGNGKGGDDGGKGKREGEGETKTPGRTKIITEQPKVEEPKTTEPQKTQETIKLKPR